MSLKSAKSTPQEIIQERKGFITSFKTPGIYELKTDAAKTSKNKFNSRTGDYQPLQDEYIPPSDHKFRDLEIPKPQKDFTLRYKCPPAYNQNGMSEHDMRPKEVLDRQRRNDETAKIQKQLEYQALMSGMDLSQKKDWIQYHTLPHLLTPVAQDFKDAHSKQPVEKNPFLDKEEFTPAYL